MIKLFRLLIITSILSACATVEEVPQDNPVSTDIVLDKKLIELNKRISGFGGMYFDSEGNLNVYLKANIRKMDAKSIDASQKNIRTAVESVFEKELISPRNKARSEHKNDSMSKMPYKINLVQGKYDILQLVKWRRSMDNVLEISGVVFTDLDEKNNRLKVGIESQVSIDEVNAYLKKIGIPHEAVIIEDTKPIRFHASLRNKHRSMPGAVQVSADVGWFSYKICTMGFNAIRSNVNGFVTNSHCTRTQGGSEGTDFHQPSESWWSEFWGGSNKKVGDEIADPAYFTGGVCPAGRQCRFSDSAFVDYTISRGKNIARTTSWNNGSLTINSSRPRLTIVDEISSWVTGSELDKIGRTTGWTYGHVNGTCQNINVADTDITLICQHRVNRLPGRTYSMSDNGDSGSPVFQWLGTTVNLSGILWGGPDDGSSFVFSPMDQIEQELGALTTYNFPSSQPSDQCSNMSDCPIGDCVSGPGIGHNECINGRCVCLPD